MNNCNGAPAELSALAYVEGTLPEADAERFEEHFFTCAVCLAYLQTIQAVGAGMAKLPAPAAMERRRSSLLSWPTRTWVFGAAAAALLVVGVFAYRAANPGTKENNSARNAPQATAPAQPAKQPAGFATEPAGAAAQAAAPVKASLLANLALPAFVAPNLRGDAEDASFLDGMKAYSVGDCAGAIPELAKVADASRDARAARFYTGACQMHLGDLSSAAATLRAVADAGDSAQQESAYYYLAQVELAQNDAPAAHKFLKKTVALKGDLERQAAEQDKRVLEVIQKGS